MHVTRFINIEFDKLRVFHIHFSKKKLLQVHNQQSSSNKQKTYSQPNLPLFLAMPITKNEEQKINHSNE